MEGTRESSRAALEVRTVVVGLDGSDESCAALTWAARLVGSEGVVHTVAAVSPALGLALAAVQLDSASLIDRVGADLETVWTTPARSLCKEVTCSVVEDDPATAVLRIAAEVDADLIAVGMHAKPKLAPRTLGRVTTKLIQRTDRPLVIVEPEVEPVVGESATAVVGVGFGIATRAAIHWAAGFAEAHGMALSLVRAVSDVPLLRVDGLLDVLAYYLDPAVLEKWAQEDLDELADEIQRSTESDLTISWSATSGAPGPKLVEASSGASLLVIGRHEGRLGPAIQPALHHVVTHAPCPVVIIPPPG